MSWVVKQPSVLGGAGASCRVPLVLQEEVRWVGGWRVGGAQGCLVFRRVCCGRNVAVHGAPAGRLRAAAAALPALPARPAGALARPPPASAPHLHPQWAQGLRLRTVDEEGPLGDPSDSCILPPPPLDERPPSQASMGSDGSGPSDSALSIEAAAAAAAAAGGLAAKLGGGAALGGLPPAAAVAYRSPKHDRPFVDIDYRWVQRLFEPGRFEGRA